MHPEAWHWLRTQIQPTLAGAAHVVDLGGRDVNGSPRALFSPQTQYRAVDAVPGLGVSLVVDAVTWTPERDWRAAFDVALSTETFEHVARWPALLHNLWLLLRPGGTVLVTCAMAPRRPHGADGSEPPPVGEWYANVDPRALEAVMRQLFRDVELQTHPRGDLYARGRR